MGFSLLSPSPHLAAPRPRSVQMGFQLGFGRPADLLFIPVPRDLPVGLRLYERTVRTLFFGLCSGVFSGVFSGLCCGLFQPPPVAELSPRWSGSAVLPALTAPAPPCAHLRTLAKMKRVNMTTMAICVSIYLVIGFAGVLMLGEQTPDDILTGVCGGIGDFDLKFQEGSVTGCCVIHPSHGTGNETVTDAFGPGGSNADAVLLPNAEKAHCATQVRGARS